MAGEPISMSKLRSLQRRERALSAIEKEIDDAPAPETIEIHFVQITSLTQTSGRYPGKRYNRDANADTFTDPSDVIWIDSPNDNVLGTGIYFTAKATGTRATDGKPIFDVIGQKTLLRGKLDGSLSYQGSATMSIWYYNGSAEADTTVNVTVYDWLLVSGQSIASGKQVAAFFDPVSNRYYVLGAQCG